MRRQAGFTLVELLMVLAILSILVGITSLSVFGYLDVAKTVSMDAEREIVSRAMDAYTTQDVMVDDHTPIAARTTAAIIAQGDSDAPFMKYLQGSTRYAYTWDVEGVDLTTHPQDESAIAAVAQP